MDTESEKKEIIANIYIEKVQRESIQIQQQPSATNKQGQVATVKNKTTTGNK